MYPWFSFAHQTRPTRTAKDQQNQSCNGGTPRMRRVVGDRHYTL